MLEATISLHRSVCAKFLPTAIKFYYGFNLRDLSCLVQVRTSYSSLCLQTMPRFGFMFFLKNSSTPGVLRTSLENLASLGCLQRH